MKDIESVLIAILMCNNRTTESTIATVVTVAKPQPGDTCANYIKVDTKNVFHKWT